MYAGDRNVDSVADQPTRKYAHTDTGGFLPGGRALLGLRDDGQPHLRSGELSRHGRKAAGEAMNKAQKAALDDEQLDLLDFAQRQQLRTHPAIAITELNHQVVRALTALADARLEVVRLNQGWVSDNQRLLLEVARLVEERDFQASEVERLKPAVEADVRALNQQREDIERLVELASRLLNSCSYIPAQNDRAVLAKLKEKYPK